jgi:hypothetical protein
MDVHPPKNGILIGIDPYPNGNLGVWVVPKFADPLHLACAPTGEVAAELSCDGPCQRATRRGATPRDFGGGWEFAGNLHMAMSQNPGT